MRGGLVIPDLPTIQCQCLFLVSQNSGLLSYDKVL